MYERLEAWNVKIFFSDKWSSYSELIPPELFIQTKRETHGIEGNNMPQRHWFGRFRRKTRLCRAHY
jgi:IS1 family transposase